MRKILMATAIAAALVSSTATTAMAGRSNPYPRPYDMLSGSHASPTGESGGSNANSSNGAYYTYPGGSVGNGNGYSGQD